MDGISLCCAFLNVFREVLIMMIFTRSAFEFMNKHRLAMKAEGKIVNHYSRHLILDDNPVKSIDGYEIEYVSYDLIHHYSLIIVLMRHEKNLARMKKWINTCEVVILHEETGASCLRILDLYIKEH